MKSTTILFFAVVLFISACNNIPGNKQSMDVMENMDEGNVDGSVTIKKYLIKSGVITYETRMKTLSVDLKYKSMVYFDNFGMKECKDTYDGNELGESYLSDGKYLYQVSHKTKEVYKTGAATHGTEPKFNWDKVSQKDKDSGIAIKLPHEIIAGKDCEVYLIKTDIATAKYAGWKNISMLLEVKSAGGTSVLKAIEVEIGPVPAEKFKLPAGYKLR